MSGPPDISGKWKGDSVVLAQHPGHNADLDGATAFQKVYTVDQEGMFVTWRSQADGGRPIVLSQLGVWRPVYRNYRIDNWELYITDYDDNQTAIVQVTSVNADAYPLSLIRTSFESGFNRQDHLQKSEVISTTLTRY